MRYVIALGGNALAEAASLNEVASAIARLYVNGNDIVVTHGNGPQVGELSRVEKLSLPILTAQTGAWIGMEISDRISRALAKIKTSYGYSIPAIVLTNVVVSSDRKEFKNPTKPIGRFLSTKEARLMRGNGFAIKRLIHGNRRVVPSPSPVDIVQKGLVRRLLDDRHIVIACGGGGIPMKSVHGRLEYVDAVIDKDRASALLANEIDADRFIVLTNVAGVYLNFGSKGQKLIERASADSMERYVRMGYFEEGSMKPKVESCVYFARSAKRSAGIGDMSNPYAALSMKELTVVTP